jgi:hypothetical protein
LASVVIQTLRQHQLVGLEFGEAHCLEKIKCTWDFDNVCANLAFGELDGSVLDILLLL